MTLIRKYFKVASPSWILGVKGAIFDRVVEDRWQFRFRVDIVDPYYDKVLIVERVCLNEIRRYCQIGLQKMYISENLV